MKKFLFLMIVLFLSIDKVYSLEKCELYNEKLVDIGYNFFYENLNLIFDKNDYINHYGGRL